MQYSQTMTCKPKAECHMLEFSGNLNLHSGKQKQATSHDKVKHKLLFYLCLNHLPPSPLLLYLISLGSQASVPQKADMPKLRGVGAMGGDGQLCGHLDRASTEHMQQFSSAAPTYTFPRRSLDLQRQQDSLVDKYTKKKKSQSIIWEIKGVATAFRRPCCDWNGLKLMSSFFFFLGALKVAVNKGHLS